MKSFGGQHTHIIQETGADSILKALKARGIKAGHFNNGTFMLPEEKLVPAFLSAFKRVVDLRNDNETPLIVAINSDKSMLASYQGKENEQDLIRGLVPQQQRAEMVVSILSALWPERDAAAIFYDEDTPYALYSGLHGGGFGLKSLHKVGYGTNPSDKPIIGAEFFDWVYACPLYNDERPVMHKETRNAQPADRQPDLVERLTDETGPHGKPYITAGGKLLFPVPPALQKYAPVAEDGPRPEAP
ncbi:MAG: hypothetical protein WC989_00195 [Micavibrio sp.]